MMPDNPPQQTATGVTSGARDSRHTERRSVARYPFVATAEVTESGSEIKLWARASELSLKGCRIDTGRPFLAGARIHLQLLRGNGAFKTQAKVIYSLEGIGMGIVFLTPTPDQQAVLEGWLLELVTSTTELPGSNLK